MITEDQCINIQIKTIHQPQFRTAGSVLQIKTQILKNTTASASTTKEISSSIGFDPAYQFPDNSWQKMPYYRRKYGVTLTVLFSSGQIQPTSNEMKSLIFRPKMKVSSWWRLQHKPSSSYHLLPNLSRNAKEFLSLLYDNTCLQLPSLPRSA